MRYVGDDVGQGADDLQLGEDAERVLGVLRQTAQQQAVFSAVDPWLERAIRQITQVLKYRMNRSAQAPEALTCSLSAIAHDWLTPEELRVMLVGRSLSTARRLVERYGEEFKGRRFIHRSLVERKRDEWCGVQHQRASGDHAGGEAPAEGGRGSVGDAGREGAGPGRAA